MQTPGLMGIAATAVARGAGLNQLERGGRHLVANSWGQVLSGLVRQVGTFGREFTEYSCWSGRCSFCSGCGSCHRHPVQYAILSTGRFNLLVLKSNKDIWGRGNPQTYERIKLCRNDENNEPSESSQIGGQSQNQKIYSKTTLADQPDRYFPQSESVVLSRSQLLFLKVGW